MTTLQPACQEGKKFPPSLCLRPHLVGTEPGGTPRGRGGPRSPLAPRREEAGSRRRSRNPPPPLNLAPSFRGGCGRTGERERGLPRALGERRAVGDSGDPVPSGRARDAGTRDTRSCRIPRQLSQLAGLFRAPSGGWERGPGAARVGTAAMWWERRGSYSFLLFLGIFPRLRESKVGDEASGFPYFKFRVKPQGYFKYFVNV